MVARDPTVVSALVLSLLRGAPFEPLEEASLENLTRKTIFLIVLASRRCHSEVHSFSGLPSAVSFSDAQDWVTLVEPPPSYPLLGGSVLTIAPSNYAFQDYECFQANITTSI